MLQKRSKIFSKNSGIAEFEVRQRMARMRRQAAVVQHFEKRKECQPDDATSKRALLVTLDSESTMIPLFSETLIHCYGYASQDIFIFNNPHHSDHLMHPTRVNVMRQLRKLLLVPGLTHFFFYFSGIAVLRIHEIYNLFQTLPVTAKVTCILDTPIEPELLVHTCLGYKYNRTTKAFERVDRPLASVPLLVSIYRTGGESECLGKAMHALIRTPNANTYQDVLTASGPESGLMASRMILASRIVDLLKK
jgi:hypothetical protein